MCGVYEASMCASHIQFSVACFRSRLTPSVVHRLSVCAACGIQSSNISNDMLCAPLSGESHSEIGRLSNERSEQDTRQQPLATEQQNCFPKKQPNDGTKKNDSGSNSIEKKNKKSLRLDLLSRESSSIWPIARIIAYR